MENEHNAEYRETELVMDAAANGAQGGLSTIDERLAGLYQRATGPEVAAVVPVSRAVLFNLVAYALTHEDAARVARDAARIVRLHPCRVIIVEQPADVGDRGGADVSVVCGITERGERRLCGEVIRVHTHEERAVVGSVLPLLIPDVPLIVWAPGDIPSGDAAFRDLASPANRMIIDSRTFSDLEEGLVEVDRFCRTGKPCGAVQDLTWVSLLPWRELTAQHFDPPTVRPYLARLLDIAVGFGADDSGAAAPVAPLLFASWLIERMQLRVRRVSRSEDGEHRIEAEQQGQPVVIRLVAEEAPEGRVTAVAIRCGSEHGPATFRVQGVSDAQLTASEQCEGVCFPSRTIDIPAAGEAELVSQAVDLPRRDKLYEAALAVACDVLARQ